MAVKKLEKYFIGKGEVRGFLFRQVFESLNAYLYAIMHSDGSMYYEAFKKRINTLYNTESYPSSKQFGISAWTFTDYNKALNKFNQLNNN